VRRLLRAWWMVLVGRRRVAATAAAVPDAAATGTIGARGSRAAQAGAPDMED